MNNALRLAALLLALSGCVGSARAKCLAYGYLPGQVACAESLVPPEPEPTPAITLGGCTQVDALAACIEREVKFKRSVAGYFGSLLLSLVQLALSVV